MSTVSATSARPCPSRSRAPTTIRRRRAGDRRRCTRTSGSPFAAGATHGAVHGHRRRVGLGVVHVHGHGQRPAPRLTRTRFLAFGDSVTAGEVTAPIDHNADREGQPNFRLIVVPRASYPSQLLPDAARAVQRSGVGARGHQLRPVPANGRRTARCACRACSPIPSGGRAAARGLQRSRRVRSPRHQQRRAAIDTMAKEIRNRGARVFLATLPPPAPGRQGIPASQVICAQRSHPVNRRRRRRRARRRLRGLRSPTCGATSASMACIRPSRLSEAGRAVLQRDPQPISRCASLAIMPGEAGARQRS